jgi:hypothetical protein
MRKMKDERGRRRERGEGGDSRREGVKGRDV